MRKRDQILAEIDKKKEHIRILKDEIYELVKENLLLSDREQRFEEKEEEIIVKRRPKITEKHLVGRIYWTEGFKDEDTDSTIYVERSQVVRIDGEWQ